MHKFFFNDECLPACENLQEFVAHLSNTLLAYNALEQDVTLRIAKGIVTKSFPSDIQFGNFSLEEAIHKIENNDLRKLAYGYFKDHPLDKFLSREHELEILEKDYSIVINGEKYDVLYLAWVGKENAFLFTVALHPDLQKEALTLVSSDEATKMQVYNLYGEDKNTDFIKKRIETLNYALLDTWEQVLAVVKKTNEADYSTKFERDFSNLSQAEQQSIIDDFQKAKARKLASPFFPDTKIIKDVSPDNAKCSVYELRVYTPKALRVYFHETEDKVFLASVEYKTDSNQKQSQDIRTAHNLLVKRIKTQ